MLDDVVREAEALEAIDLDQRLFFAAQIGEHLEEALADPHLLITVSEEFARLAQTLNCDRIMGASSVGERLASAVIVVANNGLRLYQPRQPADHVLVVDSVAATGAQIAAACKQVTADGAARVSAAAVLVLQSSRSYLAETVGDVTSIMPAVLNVRHS